MSFWSRAPHLPENKQGSLLTAMPNYSVLHGLTVSHNAFALWPTQRSLLNCLIGTCGNHHLIASCLPKREVLELRLLILLRPSAFNGLISD